MNNKENIRKWVDALRSGDYKQTKECLADQDGFCCLGVACEVAIKEGINIEKTVSVEDSNHYSYDGMDEVLPAMVAFYFGISLNPKPVIDNYGNFISLAELNDGGFSFSQIADIIEWYYL